MGISDFAFGDFDSEGRPDILYGDRSQWFVSYGGVSALIPYAVSSDKVQDLRFGDFNGDGKTDGLGVVSGS